MIRWASAAMMGLLALSSLVVTSCESAPATPVATRDSAGVSIKLSNLPAWNSETAWQIGKEPTLTVGGLAGQRRYEFTTVGEVRLLDDGRLLVAHCSNPPELRLYAADGRFVRNLVGPGSGPGQCNFILHSWLADDTAILYDPSLARITHVPIDGSPPRVIDLEAAGFGDVEGAAPLWVARFADGTFLGRPSHPTPTEDGRARVSFPYTRLDPDGMTIDTVVEVPGTEQIVRGLGTPEEYIQPVLFSPFTYVHAHGAHLYLADSGGFWIDELDPDGTLVRRFGRVWDPVPIDRGFRRNYRERRVEAAPATRRAAVRREMARAVFADHFPAHEGELIVDPTDQLWVGHVRTPGDTARTWSVFNPGGRWLGEVHVPGSLRVTDIGGDHLVGVWRGSDGVQTIRRFELIKPAPGTDD